MDPVLNFYQFRSTNNFIDWLPDACFYETNLVFKKDGCGKVLDLW